MTESSDASDTPAKPHDYAGLRTELATLVNDFAPLINEAVASPRGAQIPVAIAQLRAGGWFDGRQHCYVAQHVGAYLQDNDSSRNNAWIDKAHFTSCFRRKALGFESP